MMELNCLCDIYSGYAFKSFNDTSDGIPVIKIGNISSDGTIELTDCVYTEEVPKEKYYSKKDDIYIALSGATTGKIGVMQTDGLYVINQRVGIIRNKGKIPNDYLKYFLVSKSNQILKEASGCAQPNISPKQISKYDISIQTEEKMLLITQQLKKIEVILQNYRNQIDLLDELVKARFVELFGDPVYNEKQWKVEQFGSLGELKRGKSKHRPRNDPILLGGKYPLIQTGDISNSHTYIQTYKSTYSEEGLKQSKMWKAGTLCITIAANIAESAILTFDACFPDSIVGFLPNDKVNLIFIHHWLDFLQPILEENAPAVAQKNLNVASLEKVGVILPPLELQNQFADFVKEVDKSKVVSWFPPNLIISLFVSDSKLSG